MNEMICTKKSREVNSRCGKFKRKVRGLEHHTRALESQVEADLSQMGVEDNMQLHREPKRCRRMQLSVVVQMSPGKF